MSFHHNSKIITENLLFYLDTLNPKSNLGSGNWKDLTQYQRTGTDGSFMSDSSLEAFTNFTCSIWIKPISEYVGYATHPLNKWTSTTNATFVLYYFGTTGSTRTLEWYGTVGGVWGGLGSPFVATLGQWYNLVLQFSVASGAQMWKNGIKLGGRNSPGAISNNTAYLRVYVAEPSIEIGTAAVYNRELADTEIVYNYNCLKGRFGL